jgi:hypothetical protein
LNRQGAKRNEIENENNTFFSKKSHFFPLRGARRGFEVHATEPPSARSDAADWAGTVGMGVVFT